MFRSTSRVFFLLICATGTTAAMAVNEKIDIDIPIATDCRTALQNGSVETIYAEYCATTATKICYGDNGDGFASKCVVGCRTCPSGYTLKDALGTADATTSDEFIQKCTFSYKTCEEVQCNLACAIGLPRWMDVKNANYQIMTNKTLDRINCKCVTTTLYRCKAGYYMNGPSAIVRKEDSSTLYIPPCNRCPYAQDKNLLLSYGTSDPGSNAGQSSCYMEKGDSYSHKVSDGLKNNTIGKYRLSVDCYYDQPSN